MTTSTYLITNTNDDGYVSGSGGGIAGGIWVGSYGGLPENAFFRFTSVNIPQGATITSAILQLNQSGSDGSTGLNLRIRCQAVDNSPGGIVDTASYNAAVKTTAYDDFTGVATGSGLRNFTATNSVQEVINRSGWVSGNAITVFAMDNGSTSNTDIGITDYSVNVANSAKLVITYTVSIYTLQPAEATSKDCYIQNFSTNGNGSKLYLGDGYDTYETLVQFDLTGISGTIQSAILSLYKEGGSPQDTGSAKGNGKVYPITQSWVETLASPPSWSTSYNIPVQSLELTSGWVNWDVTNIVKDWVGGTLTNNGILVEPYGISYYTHNFTSSAGTTAANRPKLVITMGVGGTQYTQTVGSGTVNPIGTQTRQKYSTSTVTLQPDSTLKDTCIIASNPTNNYATSNMWVGNDSWGLFQFDLSSIPANATVNTADFTLTISAYSADSITTSGYLITSAWTEAGVTWNTRPTIDNSSVCGTQTYVVSSGGTKTWTITPIIQALVSHAVTDYGFAIGNSDYSLPRRTTFYSSDNATPSNRPKLVITYTAPVGVNQTYTQTVGSATSSPTSTINNKLTLKYPGKASVIPASTVARRVLKYSGKGTVTPTGSANKGYYRYSIFGSSTTAPTGTLTPTYIAGLPSGTITVGISNQSTDTGFANSAGEFNIPYTPWVGNYGGKVEKGFWWISSVGIPSGATITSATFKVHTISSGPTVSVIFRALKDANPSRPNSIAVYDDPMTTASSQPTNFVNVQDYVIDVTSVIQEIVSMPGWNLGNSLVMLGCDNNNALNEDVGFSISNVSNNQLTINYTAAAPASQTYSITVGSSTLIPSSTVAKRANILKGLATVAPTGTTTRTTTRYAGRSTVIPSTTITRYTKHSMGTTITPSATIQPIFDKVIIPTPSSTSCRLIVPTVITDSSIDLTVNVPSVKSILTAPTPAVRIDLNVSITPSKQTSIAMTPSIKLDANIAVAKTILNSSMIVPVVSLQLSPQILVTHATQTASARDPFLFVDGNVFVSIDPVSTTLHANAPTIIANKAVSIGVTSTSSTTKLKIPSIVAGNGTSIQISSVSSKSTANVPSITGHSNIFVASGTGNSILLAPSVISNSVISIAPVLSTSSALCPSSITVTSTVLQYVNPTTTWSNGNSVAVYSDRSVQQSVSPALSIAISIEPRIEMIKLISVTPGLAQSFVLQGAVVTAVLNIAISQRKNARYIITRYQKYHSKGVDDMAKEFVVGERKEVGFEITSEDRSEFLLSGTFQYYDSNGGLLAQGPASVDGHIIYTQLEAVSVGYLQKCVFTINITPLLDSGQIDPTKNVDILKPSITINTLGA